RVDEVADHRLDVAPDVADLGELRRLDLDEGRVDQVRDAPRDLGLADARRADQDQVLREDVAAHLLVEELAAEAIADRGGDRLLRGHLPDDVLGELLDDPPRGELEIRVRRAHPAPAPSASISSTWTLSLV